MYKIQSILFNKKVYTKSRAKLFLFQNNFKQNKIDETENFYRFRQINPDDLKSKGFKKIITKKIGDGIDFIIYYK